MRKQISVIIGMVTLGLCKSIDHPINQDVVNEIKQKTNKWTPSAPEDNPLFNLTHWQLHMILGTVIKPPQGTMMPPQENVDIPKEFDARTQWKDCIHPIRNQEKCGSCWAFAASEAFSDRVCIASKGAMTQVYSPESLVECDTKE